MSMSPGAWMAVDWLIIGLAARATCTLLVLSTGGYKWLANPWLMSATFCVSVTVAGLVFGLYERPTLLSRSRILLRSALSLSLGVTLAFAGLTMFFYAYASRWIGLSVSLAYLLAAVPLRLFAHEVISTSPVRLVCVGAGQSVRKLVGILGHLHRQHYQVLGHVRVQQGQGDRPPAAGAGVPLLLSSAGEGHAERGRSPSGASFQSEADLDFEAACPCLGGLDQVIEMLAAHAVDEIVVASELASDPGVGRAVAPCLEGRCRVTDQATFVEKLLGEVPAESITAEWFLRADVQNRGNYEAVSRTMDLCVAAVGLLLTLPIWPLIALLIWLDSRGPVLFRQVRVGQHGRCFSICKFRTMRPDAEKDGASWARQNDARVTRVGRYLRKSRLDELPQLLNILRGDMSLVGPRPERPEFVHNLEQLLPHYRLRHLIRPGLTGWAQIHYGYGSNVADAHRKLCYDLYYLKHRSVELDLAILIRTFGTFVLGAR
jgi:lipopolysaccharide/colanic/teichoic acid biosynthesis glycosyltransferase